MNQFRGVLKQAIIHRISVGKTLKNYLIVREIWELTQPTEILRDHRDSVGWN